MTSDFDDPLEFETLAAALKMDQQASADMVEQLARMLENCLPDQIEVKRGGGWLSKDKKVEQVTVKFEDTHYQIAREGQNRFTAKSLKVVRGIALKTNPIALDQCLKEIVAQVTALASHNEATRRALNKFVLG
jgi:hypothetical protein